MRICSLLPSSTEILFALGLEEQVVGVTHECDYPQGVSSKARVTRSASPAGLSSGEIDHRVRQQVEGGESLYELDVPLLESLKPDIVFTQQLCTVCAVSYENVHRAAASLPGKPNVVNLEPTSLNDIFSTILQVGALTGVPDRAAGLVRGLRRRIERVRRLTKESGPRKMLFLEWVDPPFCSGHWIPELITYAGGVDELAKRHQPSGSLAWERILSYNPEVIVISCCGFSVDRALEEARLLKEFTTLSAIHDSNVYVVDGSSYFSRPGPRIVDSLEILATILHPEIFPIDYPDSVVRRIDLRKPVHSPIKEKICSATS